MIFSCCDPQVSEATQVSLTLHLVCGFTMAEIASAFLRTRPAIEKRIERGKKALARSKHLFDLADGDLKTRLSAVHRALYLLFNEGYHGASAVRAELCREAIRLGALLLENHLVASPASYALCALMNLHAARLPARLNQDGDLVPLAQQDRSLWDAELIGKGNELLDRSALGAELSAYHVEAAIAAVHSNASRDEDIDWERLVWLYDMLMRIDPSPVVALNRAIAVAHREGPERGIEALRAIADGEILASYPFSSAALGELELRAGDAGSARKHFEEALALARNRVERRFLERRLDAVRDAAVR
jgi:predicted RNA polymerase sigma factor